MVSALVVHRRTVRLLIALVTMEHRMTTTRSSLPGESWRATRWSHLHPFHLLFHEERPVVSHLALVPGSGLRLRLLRSAVLTRLHHAGIGGCGQHPWSAIGQLHCREAKVQRTPCHMVASASRIPARVVICEHDQTHHRNARRAIAIIPACNHHACWRCTVVGRASGTETMST